MATNFINLCEQILAASSHYASFDAPIAPLSSLLNEMTHSVVTSGQTQNNDESIVYGYSFFQSVKQSLIVQTFFFFCRLQILLLSDVERVRAASLRALRYSIHRSTIFDKFIECRLDYLVCR